MPDHLPHRPAVVPTRVDHDVTDHVAFVGRYLPFARGAAADAGDPGEARDPSA